MRTVVVMAAMALVMIGCNREQVVESGISDDGQVECPSADVRTTYEDTNPNCEIYSCRWLCVDYEGETERYVDRQYKACTGSTYVFEAEYVREARASDCMSED